MFWELSCNCVGTRWPLDATAFDTLYYQLLLNFEMGFRKIEWPFQYVDVQRESLMMTDLVLLEDKSYLKWVKVYAKAKDNLKTYKAFKSWRNRNQWPNPTEWV
jgi:hypothetical protein